MRVPSRAQAQGRLGLLSSILLCLPGSARAQSCDYPWTVTATPVDSQTVAVHLCGSWYGCVPHDPQFFRTVGSDDRRRRSDPLTCR